MYYACLRLQIPKKKKKSRLHALHCQYYSNQLEKRAEGKAGSSSETDRCQKDPKTLEQKYISSRRLSLYHFTSPSIVQDSYSKIGYNGSR